MTIWGVIGECRVGYQPVGTVPVIPSSLYTVALQGLGVPDILRGIEQGPVILPKQEGGSENGVRLAGHGGQAVVLQSGV